MLAFVLDKHGKPLMPCKPSKARRLLKAGEAKVVSREPFTIKLLFGSSEYKQKIEGGMDVGGKFIGCAAVANEQVVYQSEVALRGDEVKKKMQQRAMYRKTRRGRKLRYRKQRFNNRGNSKKLGRLPPSVKHKIQAHEREKKFIESILPITDWNIETTQFDNHKISNPKVSRSTYSKGRQKDYYNVKAFVLQRDNYKCQCSKGKCSEKLQVHHIVFRSEGGSDLPENLITLCATHHKVLHDGKLGDFLKLQKSLAKKAIKKVKYATHANTVSAFIRRSWKFDETYGYETKYKRERLGLSKTHFNDAVAICLKDGETVKLSNTVYLKRCVQRGDYQQYKGQHSNKKIPTGKIMGIRKFDKVEWNGTKAFIKGRLSKGYAVLMDITGKRLDIRPMAKLDKVKRISARKVILTQTKILA